MAFMDKVKFWKKGDNDFSFDDSSNMGSDPFSTSADASSGLPPDPMAGGSANDPFASNPVMGGENSGLPPDPVGGGDPFASPSSSQPSFGSPADSSGSSDPFGSSQNTQDPFARPSAPPKSATIGQSLAHKYIQGEQQSSSPSSIPLPSNPLQPGTDIEMISLKLDAIRSELNSMAQRMMRLEHLIEEQNKKRGW